MLSERFRADNQPVIDLNEVQARQREAVAQHLASGAYRFEDVRCVLCGGRDGETLSEKDRYGLRSPVWVCTTCGLIQANPRMTRESYARFYESDYRKLHVGTEAPTESFFRRQHQHGRGILEFIVTTGRGRYRPFTGKFVVEIGTGAGGILQAFKDAGNDVFGTDLGSEYLEFGIQQGLDLRVGTVGEVVKLGRKADLIIYSHSLEHVLDPVAELTQAKGVLAPGGIIYVEVPGVMALTHSYRQDFLRSLQIAHTYYFSKRTLLNVARMAGLLLVRGDEDIRALFTAGNDGGGRESDYPIVTGFLRDMEHRRLRRFNLHRIKQRVRSVFLGVLRSLGMLGITRRAYNRMKQ